MIRAYSAQLYHWFVRPKWLTKWYIHNPISEAFQLNGRYVLDFGSGTGANCSLFEPTHYVGADPDAGRIRYARKLYPRHSFQVLADNRLPASDDSVDYIVIIAVLHHISSEEIAPYMAEFRRILKPSGTIIVMEPCLCRHKPISSRFMKLYDKGRFIRDEEGYLELFRANAYECSVIKRFRKCLLYHELFFTAVPKPQAALPDLT